MLHQLIAPHVITHGSHDVIKPRRWSCGYSHHAGQAGDLAIRADDKVGLGVVQVDVVGGQLVAVLSRKSGRLRDAHMAAAAAAGAVACAPLSLHHIDAQPASQL